MISPILAFSRYFALRFDYVNYCRRESSMRTSAKRVRRDMCQHACLLHLATQRERPSATLQREIGRRDCHFLRAPTLRMTATRRAR